MSAAHHESVRVLYADDEPDFADLAAMHLEREREAFDVCTATSATEGLDRLAGEDIDCIVSDYDMPGMDGLDFLEAVREEYPDLPFILFTGRGSEEMASLAISSPPRPVNRMNGRSGYSSRTASRNSNPSIPGIS